MLAKLQRWDFWRYACSVLWQTCIILLYSSWWGGLSFYAIVVVPIGTDQISSVGQGFITQEVTYRHNLLAVAMTICLAIEATRHKSRWLWTIVGGMTAVTIALMSEHSRLTGMMNFANRSVPNSFYQQHAIYLWITAAEWTLGILIPPIGLIAAAANHQPSDP